MLNSKNLEGPVVLVNREIEYAFPFGIAYVAGYLCQKKEKPVVLFKPNNPRMYKSLVQTMLSLKPLVVGFGGLFPDLYSFREVIKMIRAEDDSFPIVIGGQMVSPTPEFSVRITGADYGVIGEGEITFYNLVKTLREGRNTSEIKGLAISDGDTVKLTGPGEYIEDLSNLPAIPYDFFPTNKWLKIGRFYALNPQPHWKYRDRVISIHGGRGCPFNCNFCYHHSKARYRNLSEMVIEGEEMLWRYNANMLYFGDDLALSTPNRAYQLTELLGKIGRPVEYSVSCRFDILSRMDDSLLKEMKATGCRMMGLGIESGSQRILNMMHKGITVEQIRDGLYRLKKVGILPTVSIMVGQFSETEEDVDRSMSLMLESVRYNKNVQYAFTITTPFPGSELYKLALDRKLLKDDEDFFNRFDPNMQMVKVTVNFTPMSDREIVKKRSELTCAYKNIKRKMVGNTVIFLEFLQTFFAKWDARLCNRISANKFLIYNYLYDFIQIPLERLRFKFLGLKW